MTLEAGEMGSSGSAERSGDDLSCAHREMLSTDTMNVIRRRDHSVCQAEIVRLGGEAYPPILLSEGAPFPPGETAGYFLAEASETELAELRRGGYTLLHAVGGGASR